MSNEAAERREWQAGSHDLASLVEWFLGSLEEGPGSGTSEGRALARAAVRLSLVAMMNTTLDELLKDALRILVEVASADVGVARVREGKQLRSRVSLGLEDEVESEFILSVDDALSGMTESEGGAVSSCSTATGAWSPQMRRHGVQALLGVPLRHKGDLLAVIYLGMTQAPTDSVLEERALAFLVSPLANAVSRQLELDALRQGIRFRDDILGMVAHDLRNPLNVISLAANNLVQRITDPPIRRPLERIVRGVQRAERLVQDLLVINAIENDQFRVERRPVETIDTILAVLESQQSLAADASIIIATDLSPDLPPINADQERIFEVLENLIGNAIKFTAPGGSVTVGASTRNHDLLFWVKDSGEGVEQEQLAHLFDRFWQASKRDRRGSGLGLAICRAIVEAHGGRIWADGRKGEGTTVFFTIPALTRVTEPKIAEIAPVLLVDDRPENLLALQAILDRPDYRLVTAKSGKEALSLALQNRFAVALIDIAMPGMNGLEVAVHLKELERTRDIPIIFITAFGDDPEEVHRAYSAGGADYLVKPLDPEIVRKKVAVFVDLSRRRNLQHAQELTSHV